METQKLCDCGNITHSIFLQEDEPQKPQNFKKIQSQVPELQFLKMLVFPRALLKL